MSSWHDDHSARLDEDDDYRPELMIGIGICIMLFCLGVAVGCVFG
jgi:hypothetical protein